MNIRNPIIIEGNGANWRSITYKGNKYSTRDLEKMFKDSNHDGVIVKNINDVGGGANRNTPKYSNIRFVYKADQVKSATDNNGDYSRENNNIKLRKTKEDNELFLENGYSENWIKNATEEEKEIAKYCIGI